MPKRSSLDSSSSKDLHYGLQEFAQVDVGEISDVYPDPADRQAVHDAYERGNTVAAEKHEPPFDNRFGFAGSVLKH
jgi:hypothetical protein